MRAVLRLFTCYECKNKVVLQGYSLADDGLIVFFGECRNCKMLVTIKVHRIKWSDVFKLTP